MASHLSPAYDTKELELDEGELSPEERAALDKIVWNKLDRRVLPLCTCLFILYLVDWGNVGNANVAGLRTSLGMSSYQFTIALMASFIAYIISEFPSTWLLKRVGFHIMLPAMAVLWGICSGAQGFVHNFSGLLACRFFLGIVEAGLFPGIVLYLSIFYPREKLQTRVSIFWATTSLCGAFSGLLAAAIVEISPASGRPGWAWIFILEGAVSILFGVVTYLLLPRSPEQARFFTVRERAYVIAALKRAGSVAEDGYKDDFNWRDVINTLKSVHVWLLTVVCFFNGTIVFGLAYFEPSIVAGLGYTGNHAQLMSVPPFAVSFVLALISGVISDHYRCRGYTVLFFSVLGLIGFCMFYASTSNHVRYASLFFSVSGLYCQAASLTTWLANNSAPHTRRATAVALVSVMSEGGGILTTWLLGYLSLPPDYTVATVTFIVMCICQVLFTTANWLWLWQANREKAERRAKMRKEDEPEGLGDQSAWFIYSL